MRKIIASDFDGTLTSRDTLLLFIRHSCGTWRFLAGFLLYAPMIALMKLRLVRNDRMKQRLFTHFFRGMYETEFAALCDSFARSHRHILRPLGQEMIATALREGATVVVISASIDRWVRPFFPSDILVVGTEIEVVDGMLTGRFATANCYGREKVRRLESFFPDRSSYHLTAYGDSKGDRELLAYADEAYYKPFRQL